ncbi:hypothetical protein CAPTEDRAFT_211164 [Capitella teleta]|uniref:Sulfotransferase domain-containing protein n=1 Tax=Capitella teleta TaxID=283909 RepID=R7UAR3_CAPTE|nr:hypothetical protein CAPTEDRAFT_211164 [Capitella teleta]|eukprot:ELU03226.1 hypothetical protein CAPTEDRAFT_211164 [Capitella teleta]
MVTKRVFSAKRLRRILRLSRRGRQAVMLLGLLLAFCAVSIRPQFSNQQNQAPHRHVFIVSYFRAGSSAIRRLFEQHDDVLVWEDPVAPLAAGWRHMHHDERMRLQHDRDRALLIEEISQREDSMVEPLLSAILSCDIGAIYRIEPAVLEWAVGRQLYDAMGLVERMLYVTLGPFGLGAGMLHNRCLQFGLRVVRTTHLPMRHLPPLVETNPDLKVIYVPRDPRGMVGSWVKLDIFDESLGQHVYKKFCDSISLDLTEFNRLAARRPEHSLTIRAEDLWHEAEHSVQEIQEFLNICKSSGSPHHESVEMNWSMRDEQIHLNEALDPHVMRSSSVDLDWRGVLREKTVKDMNAVCKHALIKLRYEAFRN